MAISPGSRRGPTTGNEPHDPALNPMQEPLGSMDRPIPRACDNNDVNLAGDGTRGTSYTSATTSRGDTRSRSFTTTFAIVAAVLVAAFLVALYLGSEGRNQATAPTGTQAPVADSAPGTADDTTGSTTPAQPPQDGYTGTGTGGNTTAPVNP